MRQIAVSPKKLRGRRRRLRALARWADGFVDWFPANCSETERFWHENVPVHCSLIEGPQTSRRVQAACAQHLIDACESLARARPAGESECRVVATLCVPDMFSSGIAVYPADVLRSRLGTGKNEQASTVHITNRSLAQDWGLRIPAGFKERGLLIRYDPPDHRDRYHSEWWHVGELD